jgi:hypothetical protein
MGGGILAGQLDQLVWQEHLEILLNDNSGYENLVTENPNNQNLNLRRVHY